MAAPPGPPTHPALVFAQRASAAAAAAAHLDSVLLLHTRWRLATRGNLLIAFSSERGVFWNLCVSYGPGGLSVLWFHPSAPEEALVALALLPRRVAPGQARCT